MDAESVPALLTAVRRRVWRDRFGAAARIAAWVSAGFMLAAVVIEHLGNRSVRASELAIVLAGVWFSAGVWAASRRPSIALCALWADRHLGGESAYSTLLEVRSEKQSTDTSAARWLEQWASARVPNAKRLLAERRRSMQLARPLIVFLVSGAFAAVLLSLPGPDTSSSSRRDAPPGSDSVDSRTAAPAPLASTEVARELATELQSATRRNSSAGGHMPTAGSPAASSSADAPTAAVADRGRHGKPIERPAAATTPSQSIGDASQPSVRAPATGAGSGREAGESRDLHTSAGMSRALAGISSINKRASAAPGRATDKRADMAELGTYDDLRAHTATVRAETRPLPATSPPVDHSAVSLSPTQAAYVHAWIKASGER
jgi:hypothetical protein